MADPEQRDRESHATEQDKYHDAREEEKEERDRLAREVPDPKPPEDE
jgi:hypothetical protein